MKKPVKNETRPPVSVDEARRARQSRRVEARDAVATMMITGADVVRPERFQRDIERRQRSIDCARRELDELLPRHMLLV
jgi:hypothetical protein